MAPGQARLLLGVQAGQWDAANLLAVLQKADRGRAEEIVSPVALRGGQRAPAGGLAAQPGLEAMAALLATWATPSPPGARCCAPPVRTPTCRSWNGGERAYFSWALEQAGSRDPDSGLVREILRMQIDLANVKAALDCVRHRMHGESVPDFRALAGGKLAPAVFKALGQAASMVEAFEALEASYFAAGIEKGILAFGLAGSLGVMERFLEVVLIRAGCRLFRTDPWASGCLGFMAQVQQ
jgi:hypothetical protein